MILSQLHHNQEDTQNNNNNSVNNYPAHLAFEAQAKINHLNPDQAKQLRKQFRAQINKNQAYYFAVIAAALRPEEKNNIKKIYNYINEKLYLAVNQQKLNYHSSNLLPKYRQTELELLHDMFLAMLELASLRRHTLHSLQIGFMVHDFLKSNNYPINDEYWQ